MFDRVQAVMRRALSETTPYGSIVASMMVGLFVFAFWLGVQGGMALAIRCIGTIAVG